MGAAPAEPRRAVPAAPGPVLVHIVQLPVQLQRQMHERTNFTSRALGLAAPKRPQFGASAKSPAPPPAAYVVYAYMVVRTKLLKVRAAIVQTVRTPIRGFTGGRAPSTEDGCDSGEQESSHH